MPSKLGYWDIRGLGQPIRNLLVYVGEDYEEDLYSVGPGPEFNKDCWFSVKYDLGLPCPNLPYYIDGDLKMTQSNAILRYLGRKYNLDGETAKEKTHCDIGLEAVMDLRNDFSGLCYGTTEEEFKSRRDAYVKNAKRQISSLNDFMADKPFLAASKVTTCDFPFYELLDQNRLFEPTMLDDFPKLQEYCQRFEDLPRIKEYLETGKVRAMPMNNKQSVFNL